ncbi:MAG: UbiA-like polyprenyltransferase [Dehalococcoidia bacterium]
MPPTAAPIATGTDHRPGSFWQRFVLFLDTIKFEHSVFALPFAVLTTFMVTTGVPSLGTLSWIIVAMVGMRTFGMGANRLIDAEIDARNPRTSSRALPAGRISKREVWLYMLVSGAAFGLAVSQLDPLAWILSPIPVLVMIGYPYLKRFTWVAHLGLGTVYLIVPPAVWIAMTGELPAGIIILGIGAMLWVTGFDVLYGTADYDVDRAQGLHSIPSRFGIARALMIARLFHAISVGCLAAAGALLGAGPLYFIGVAIAGALLAYENSLVSAKDLSRLNMAFFTMNGVIALVFGVFASLDAMLR